MRIDRWKIFNKKGSFLNPYIDSLLNIEFLTGAQNAVGAEAYALTDPSALITEVIVTNSGWHYDPATQANLIYSLGEYEELLSAAEASINFIDVSIGNTDPLDVNTTGIGSVDIDVSVPFIYPSVLFASAVFLKPVSAGLVETEHLAILEEINPGVYVKPYDPINSQLVFRFVGGDPEIRLFELSEDLQTIDWSDEIVYDASVYWPNAPLMINIGFRAEDEGVFERKLRVYHRINGIDYQLAEIMVNAESIGQDERFDTLAQNFGLHSPKNIPHLFKRADINEALGDWELLNQKGKHIVLEHSQIMPFIGTYKGLINAIKWLGYDDISVREWFRNVKEHTKLSLTVPYDAKERTKTILHFSPDERKNLKKLNELSLVYCLTRETGDVDRFGTPETENCYEYNITEVLIKLKALKDWLEKHIIGVHCRIVDITGEGIYFERFGNLIYATQDRGHRAKYTQSLTPHFLAETSELVKGEASIGMTLKELQKTSLRTYSEKRIGDFLQYYWDPSNGAFDPADASALWWDPSTVAIGSSFRSPFYELQDIQWKASVEKTFSGVLPEEFITDSLFIYDNRIKFYNVFDTSAVFYDSSTNLRLLLEEGFIRDASNPNWEESLAYSIYVDPSDAASYIFESSTGQTWKTDGWVHLRPDSSSHLEYSHDDLYNVPLLHFKNYKFTDSSMNVFTFEQDKKYFLDIVDGKISQSRYLEDTLSYIADPSIIMYRKEDYHINWNYDTSIDEQKITLNVVYTSPRAPLYVYDPSAYYHLGADSALVLDNSVYTMDVNHIGPYHIEIFGWDTQNNLYHNFVREDYKVWTKFPIIWSYLQGPCLPDTPKTLCPSAMLSVDDVSLISSANPRPIFDRHAPLRGLTLEQDSSGKYYLKVPSITYFLDTPQSGSIARFYNMVERVLDRTGDVFTVINGQRLSQEFYVGDTVNIVLFDNGEYHALDEVSGTVSAKTSNQLTITGIPAKFDRDSSTDVYVLNDTRRETANPVNDMAERTIDIDIVSYQFTPNQLVGIIIEDTVSGYSWGSSFRVIDSSDASTASGFRHHLSGNIPRFIVDDPIRYQITAKHAFSTYSDFEIDVQSATETANIFNINLDDKYYHQYYLDNTFVFVSLLFDEDRAIDQWYDPSTDGYLVSDPFYPRAKSVTIDPSTLVILDSYYDPSNYMLDQKNIWTVIEKETREILFRVHNKIVPYIFQDSGIWDVQLEAYDRYGNLKTQYFEGLITVRDA
jgi:hypothetical protein